ncbi:phosphatidate cytidylyltransferase [Brooklawnia sp.]|uniref:phosphatidate cytidylyltransferase n=1 Tax=Brooklawnia sp. TaxID=2699740 RepID=UPI00311E2689
MSGRDPDEVTSSAAVAPAAKKHSAGRNLPVAIASAVVLFAWILSSLLWWQWGFVLFLIAAAVAGSFEIWRALTRLGMHVAIVPIAIGTPLTLIAVHYLAQDRGQVAGASALVAGLALMVITALVGRLRGPVRGFIGDAAASVFTIGYVPLLLSTLALLLAQPDGNLRVIYYFILVPCSDTGAYAVGSLLGKHKMAPHISPGKTWEGLAGAIGVTMIIGAVLGPVMIDASWWAGAIIGVVLSLAATVGDLIESMIKRDAGLKDMSKLIPGHGGAMDRLDSLLVAAPIAWLSMLVLV